MNLSLGGVGYNVNARGWVTTAPLGGLIRTRSAEFRFDRDIYSARPLKPFKVVQPIKVRITYEPNTISFVNVRMCVLQDFGRQSGSIAFIQMYIAMQMISKLYNYNWIKGNQTFKIKIHYLNHLKTFLILATIINSLNDKSYNVIMHTHNTTITLTV